MTFDKFIYGSLMAVALWVIRGAAGLVTVRRYDRNGNFIGTTQMTKAQAEILGIDNF